MRETLESFGIKVVDDVGAYLPVGIVMSNIARKWDDLSKDDQDKIIKSFIKD